MEYSISQAAKHFGITAHTLRFYDKEGLLPFIDRSVNGKRIFKESDLKWLQLIECFKETGMTLKEIRNYLELCMKGDKTLRERYEIMLKHREVVEKKLEEVKRNIEKIDYKLWYYKTAIAAGTEAIHKQKPEPETSAKSAKKAKKALSASLKK